MNRCGLTRLIRLLKATKGGESEAYTTSSGTAPITFGAADGAVRRLEQTGKVYQAGTPTPQNPVDILINNGKLTASGAVGTPEVLQVSKRNLIDAAALATAPSGEIGNYTFKHKLTIRGLKPSTLYTLSTDATYDKVLYFNTSSGSVKAGAPVTKRTTADGTIDVGLYDRTGIDRFEAGAFWIWLEAGSAETVPHWQTAAVEDLLGLDDVTDEQDIISGLINRRIGVYVVTGTEQLTLQGDGKVYFTSTGVVPNLSGQRSTNFQAICTHFIYRNANIMSSMQDLEFIANGSGSPYKKNGRLGFRYEEVFVSVEAAQEWFADQLTAGTPVIIVYTLANPTTESVPPQSLQTSSGENTITVNTEISGVYLKVEHKI